MNLTKSGKTDSREAYESMFPFIAFSIQAAYAAAFGPVEANDWHYLVPPSSIPMWYDAGTAVHTHVIKWNGGQLHPNSDYVALNDLDTLSGPAARLFAPSGFSPANIVSAYDVPALAGAKAIAIIDASHYPTALSDFNTFSSQFGLPTETSKSATASTNAHFQVVYQGSSAPKVNTSWNVEEALDIEWAHAMAPEAKIYLVEANTSNFSDLFAAIKKAVALPNVKEVSMSWGGGEFNGETSYDSMFVASGVVFFASSGDAQAVREWPSESPNVVAVGGTTLNMSKGVVTSETPWSSAGGGLSSYEKIPTYQKSIASYVGSKRGAADVSAVANPGTGVAIYDTSGESGWLVVGGTSVACPVVAGIVNTSGSFLSSSELELAKIYAGVGSKNFRAISGLPKPGMLWYYATGIGSPLGTKGL
jgi:kumamolisin